MQKGLKLDGQMRALAIALGGAIVSSVVAMFIPVSVVESITGSTGISELIPATGAPLGDTAKAIIAFVFGAAAFALLAAYLLRRPGKAGAEKAGAAKAGRVSRESASSISIAEDAASPVEKPSLLDQMRAKIDTFMESHRKAKADAVTELSDLPKLRTGDAHPDAPPRRPISAHRDFGEIIDARLPSAAETDDVVEPLSADSDAVDEALLVATPPFAEPVGEDMGAGDAVVESEAPFAPAQDAPSTEIVADVTVAAMVERLENALEQRKDQLSRLEAIAAAGLADAPPVVEASPVVKARPVETEAVDDHRETSRPTSLEAVPNDPATATERDDMDAALRSALETLHRMNVRTR